MQVLYNAGSESFEHLVKLSQALWSHFTRNREFYGPFYALGVCVPNVGKLRQNSIILALFLFDPVKDGHTKS